MLPRSVVPLRPNPAIYNTLILSSDTTRDLLSAPPGQLPTRWLEDVVALVANAFVAKGRTPGGSAPLELRHLARRGDVGCAGRQTRKRRGTADRWDSIPGRRAARERLPERTGRRSAGPGRRRG